MRRDWVMLAFVAAGATVEVPADGLHLVAEAEAAAGPAHGETFDRLVQKSIHNAYARREPLVDQLAWHGVQSLELDIHASRAGVAAPDGEWLVYHEDLPLARDSSCSTLAACLRQIAAFHAAVPDHEALTLFVDLKDGFSAGHGPPELDAALERALGRGAVLAPADLVARCAGARTVREAVTGSCRFPSPRELRGRILVAVTGGTSCAAGSPVRAYAAGSRAPLAFVAPSADASCPVDALDAHPDVAFVNLSFAERERARDVRARGLVARMYYGGVAGGLDTFQDYFDARRAGAQILATDAVNAERDPWTTSLVMPVGREARARRLDAVEAESGDIGAAADSFFFAHERRELAAAETWTALASVTSSHVDPMAKACLMARAGDEPDAPHVALCRPFDEHPPRLMIRAARGASTLVQELEEGTLPGGVAETAAFLRLRLEPEGGRGGRPVRTRAVAEASADGATWATVGAATVDASLPLRGVAVASNGSRRVRALFAGVKRVSAEGMTRVRVSTLPSRSAVGARASGRVVSGDDG